jgi:hypothetical protein
MNELKGGTQAIDLWVIALFRLKLCPGGVGAEIFPKKCVKGWRRNFWSRDLFTDWWAPRSCLGQESNLRVPDLAIYKRTCLTLCYIIYCTKCTTVTVSCILHEPKFGDDTLNISYHRLNMDLDLQSLFGLHVHRCTHWPRPLNPPPPPKSAYWLIYGGAIGQPRLVTSLCDPLPCGHI